MGINGKGLHQLWDIKRKRDERREREREGMQIGIEW